MHPRSDGPTACTVGESTGVSDATFSPTALLGEFVYFRDFGDPEAEIAGMAHRAADRERLAASEPAVLAAAAETATSVARPLSTVRDTGVPSRMNVAADRLLD